MGIKQERGRKKGRKTEMEGGRVERWEEKKREVRRKTTRQK